MATKKPARSKAKKPLSLIPARRPSAAKALPIILFMALAGIVVVLLSFAAPEPKLEKFKNNAGKGWVWDGLQDPISDSSPCKSKNKNKASDLLEITDSKTNKVISCTHGPDPAPKGVDVRDRTEPLQTGESDATALAPRGGGSGDTGPATVPSAPIACDGDGVGGNRVQVIYARASDKPDRYSQFMASIQAWAASADNIFVESGLQTGSPRHVRWVHDANCYVKVDNVVLSTTGDDNINTTIGELQAQGYSRVDRKYMIWMDANVYCGISTFRTDSKPGADNINNYGQMWARIDNGCWNPTIYESPGYAYAAHELMHMMGGVQSDTPHRSYQSHCTDEYDLMCYNDDADVPLTYPRLVMTYPCPMTQLNLFDCNDDDYYHTGAPPADNYLSTHWNTANNIFLFTGSTTPPPPNGDTASPQVTITSPTNGATIRNSVTISATATDNVGVTKMEVYIDGIRKEPPSMTGSISYTWNSKSASKGAHTITVKAYDATGNPPGQTTVSVTK